MTMSEWKICIYSQPYTSISRSAAIPVRSPDNCSYGTVTHTLKILIACLFDYRIRLILEFVLHFIHISFHDELVLLHSFCVLWALIVRNDPKVQLVPPANGICSALNQRRPCSRKYWRREWKLNSWLFYSSYISTTLPQPHLMRCDTICGEDGKIHQRWMMNCTRSSYSQHCRWIFRHLNTHQLDEFPKSFRFSYLIKWYVFNYNSVEPYKYGNEKFSLYSPFFRLLLLQFNLILFRSIENEKLKSIINGEEWLKSV